MRDFTEDLADLRRRVDDAHAYLQHRRRADALAELEVEASRPTSGTIPTARRR